MARAALRLFEHEKLKKAQLLKALEKGEKSGFVEHFDTEHFLEIMQQKHGKVGP